MGITRQQALDCFASDDLIGIGMEADAVRRTLHPEGVVSYTIDRPLDCAAVDLTTLYEAAADSIDMGATSLHVLGEAVTLARYETLFAGIKERFPEVRLQGLSATEIFALSRSSSLSLIDTIHRLRAAGLDSIASSAVILDDEVRHRITPNKCTTDQWLAVHRTAHQLGMTTAATMIFGVGETPEQRVRHLERIHDLQAETGGFADFTPLVFERENPLEEPTAVEYLKTLAVSRLFLDNIPNVQASWRTQSLKVLQMGLRFGGNDVGSVLLEERQSKPGGATEEELRRVIRDAGFKPVQRPCSSTELRRVKFPCTPARHRSLSDQPSQCALSLPRLAARVWPLLEDALRRPHLPQHLPLERIRHHTPRPVLHRDDHPRVLRHPSLSARVAVLPEQTQRGPLRQPARALRRG